MNAPDHQSPRITSRTSGGWFSLALFACLLLAVPLPVRAADDSAKESSLKFITPAVSTGTGLLLEPPLDFPEFTREKFVELSSSVGAERIHKPWTNPVVTLPSHPRADVKGLTEDEVKAYMVEVKQRFQRGESVPMSNAGLISSQEDVIRKPMLNHIAAFSNSVVRRGVKALFGVDMLVFEKRRFQHGRSARSYRRRRRFIDGSSWRCINREPWPLSPA